MCDITRVQDTVQLGIADFVKVPFLQALELVGHRRVFVHNGIAYVPRDRLMTIIITRFRASVSEGVLLRTSCRYDGPVLSFREDWLLHTRPCPPF
jgi:DNA primase large subunit